MEDLLQERLARVRERIRNAAQACRRPQDAVRLIAVSKTMPAEIVQQAIEAGVTDLGENYIQEAKDKINSLARFSANWHFMVADTGQQ